MEIRKHLEPFRELLFVLKQYLIRLNVTPFSWHCPRVKRLSHAEVKTFILIFIWRVFILVKNEDPIMGTNDGMF